MEYGAYFATDEYLNTTQKFLPYTMRINRFPMAYHSFFLPISSFFFISQIGGWVGWGWRGTGET